MSHRLTCRQLTRCKHFVQVYSAVMFIWNMSANVGQHISRFDVLSARKICHDRCRGAYRHKSSPAEPLFCRFSCLIWEASCILS